MLRPQVRGGRSGLRQRSMQPRFLNVSRRGCPQHMNISSRTPEGDPNRCPVCGHALRLEPSRPPGDAPCPACGSLLWFPQSPEWHPERYRDLVLLWARQLHLDPRLQRRFDSSDLAHDTLLKAHKKIGEFRGTTEAELLRWLHTILLNHLRSQIA